MSTRAELEALLDSNFSTAVEALDHHAKTGPDRPAVLHGDTGQRLTYGQFGRLTDNLAAHLTSSGIRKGDRVAVLTTNPLIAVLTMYGVWKAGAVYAPANFQYTGELLAYQLNDSSPVALVTDSRLKEEVDKIEHDLVAPPRVIVADSTESGEFAALLQDAPRPDISLSFDDPANIIYTSGTTGPSKGVVLSHRWVNTYTWFARQVLTADDVVYNDLPMYHIAGSHISFVRVLWAGGAVSLWNRFSPQDFWRRVMETGCTSALLLDVMIPWLLKAEPAESDRRNPLNKIHLQPLPADHHKFAERFGIDFVTCGFGQSESGLASLALIEELEDGQGTPADLYRGRSHTELRELFGRYGLPVLDGATELGNGFMGGELPFIEMTVLDEQDREVPPGTVGHLALRPRVPAVLFHEYLAKPEATVNAWRNLWFHTGDAATRDDEGMFYFVDRLGDRLRVRGENISSFHIEEMLSKHPDVQLAAVVAVPSAEGSEDDVIAFVEVTDGSVFEPESLHRHCRETMPKFMWPREIVPVGQIPRTATNKIEKYKLRKGYLESLS